MKNCRVTIRRNSSYSTRKKIFKINKTPGNNHKIVYKKSKFSPIRCGVSKFPLKGLSNQNSLKFVNICKRKKKVSRIYGGCLSSNVLKERIIKAFLFEESKIGKFLRKENLNYQKNK
jgi:large subunit ribosomal protein L34e